MLTVANTRDHVVSEGACSLGTCVRVRFSGERRFCRNCLCFSNRWLLIRRSNHSPCGENALQAVADWIVSRSRCAAHGCAADSEVPSSLGLPAEGIEPTRSCDHWILSPARLPVPPRRREEIRLQKRNGSSSVSRSASLKKALPSFLSPTHS